MQSTGGVAREDTVVEVVRYATNVLELRIRGEGHTLLNLLVDELNRIPDVEATYRVDHPLLNVAHLLVRTKGSKQPLEAIREAVESLRAKLKVVAESAAALG
ncbi:RpoL/Rpb11 RNA polymerase subunit family protein [Thermofilum pendens]|uniref:DNA-directed RNA polymerase subunit Rpo11 n=1 Tax=Thermofilum pendens (strain DSM 2475 / Hrk 5) TaxID=368408 RepID=A1RX43_THEPD|nr:RpoL/Rpb11 RNA polymerase subunit family protein [Thermofilum pendens]ABL77773.1 DNA-directed RNA polymerase, subunit L [Thermofilum pendens Hrk 5]